MAEKRMFSKKIIDTDWFMDMPASSQNLYFHLSMRADDDGFVASPKRIIKLVGASEDDFKLLIAKKFIIIFDSGVCVIKDWRINNYLRMDRHTDTIYQQEKAKLSLGENGEYLLGIPCGIPVVATDKESELDLDKDIDIDFKKKLKKKNGTMSQECPEAREEITSLQKKETIDTILSAVENDTLRYELSEFVKMRKTKRNPLTPHALNLAISKLNKMTPDISRQIDLVRESISKGWLSFYEPQWYNKPATSYISKRSQEYYEENKEKLRRVDTEPF